jgi:hypothetical protein
VDCHDARLLLEMARPLATQLDAPGKKELAAHLADCPDCGPWAESERLVDEHFAQALQAVPVPTYLGQHIVSSLQSARYRWYGARIARTVATAAVLLVAVWAGWEFWWNGKPAIELGDVDYLVYPHDGDLYTPELVEEAFAGDGVSMVAPPKTEFDYTFLDSHGMARFKGQQVPYMLFIRHGEQQPAVAKVFVLSDRQFNFEDIRQGKPRTTGGRKSVAIVNHPTNKGVLYVVVFSGTPQWEKAFRPSTKAIFE